MSEEKKHGKKGSVITTVYVASYSCFCIPKTAIEVMRSLPRLY